MQNTDRRNYSLALMVAIPRPESWGDTCAAWIDSADRKCDKPRKHGYLCTRHHNVAEKRLAKRLEKEQERANRRRAFNQSKLPEWTERLDKINRELEKRTGSKFDGVDPAATGGNVHPGIAKALKKDTSRLFSDANVKRVGELIREKEQLETRINATRNM